MTELRPVTMPARGRPSWVVPAVQGAVVLALFAGAGAGCGWIWWELWSPAPSGVVFQEQWIPQPYAAGQSAEFAGTGLYVVVGIVGGLVLGLVAGLLLDRRELVTLVAVAAGSCLAAWLMLRVGVSFSAPDPEALAKTAKEGTELPGRLVLAGKSPLLAFPVGAMAGLAIALFGVSKSHRRSVAATDGPSR